MVLSTWGMLQEGRAPMCTTRGEYCLEGQSTHVSEGNTAFCGRVPGYLQPWGIGLNLGGISACGVKRPKSFAATVPVSRSFPVARASLSLLHLALSGKKFLPSKGEHGTLQVGNTAQGQSTHVHSAWAMLPWKQSTHVSEGNTAFCGRVPGYLQPGGIVLNLGGISACKV